MHEGCCQYLKKSHHCWRLLSVCLFFQTVALLEAFDTTSGVNHFLGTGEEGVASRANFQLQALGSRLGLDYIAARATNLSQFIAGVNSVFHVQIPPGICNLLAVRSRLVSNSLGPNSLQSSWESRY